MCIRDRCINYTFLGVTALLCLLPFVHLLALSFSGSVPVAAGSVGLWPRDFTFASYQFALKSPYFFRTMGNSFVRVVLGAGLNLLLMLLMAYPLSKPCLLYTSGYPRIWFGEKKMN